MVVNMIRQMIKIDEELCNGCGLCIDACHESALALVDGKAKLIRDDYCDGLGNCLPACPTGAISFEEREALPFNEEEVLRNIEKSKEESNEMKTEKVFTSCPGSRMMELNNRTNPASHVEDSREELPSNLRQWPVQIQLVPATAPYFQNADILIAADCTAFAYRDIHSFMKNKITLIGCPKLDEVDYSEKLTAILSNNNIKSVTILRMEVPCCGGIVHAAKTAFLQSGKMVPWRVITISTDGRVLEN